MEGVLTLATMSYFVKLIASTAVPICFKDKKRNLNNCQKRGRATAVMDAERVKKRKKKKKNFQIGQLQNSTSPGVCRLADTPDRVAETAAHPFLHSSSPACTGAMESRSGSPTTAWSDSSVCKNSAARVLTCLILASASPPPSNF